MRDVFALIGLIIASGLGIIAVYLLAVFLPTLLGAAFGWLIGWGFPGVVGKLLSLIYGWTGVSFAAWELGALAGLIGQLLRMMFRGVFHNSWVSFKKDES